MRNILQKFRGVNPFTLTLAAILLSLAAYVIQIPFLEIVELKTIDMRFLLRGEQKPGPETAIAVIDEKSLQELGKWPWPRTRFADLINMLSDAGASVIALDVGFLEPDMYNASGTVQEIEKKLQSLGLGDPKVFEELKILRGQGDYDAQLAQAIRNSRPKVVLGFFCLMSSEGLGKITDKERDYHKSNSTIAKYNNTRMQHGAPSNIEEIPVFKVYRAQANIPQIARAAQYAGYFNMQADRDGTFRWMPMAMRWDEELYAPLSLKAVQAFFNDQIQLRVDTYGIKDCILENAKIIVPLNEEAQFLVNYRGGRKTFPHISISDILQKKVPPEALAGKIILVGATATGIYDLRVTPFEHADYPGVEIHANVVDNIIHKDFLIRPNWTIFFDILSIILLGSILGLALPRASVLTGFLAFIGLFVVYFATSQVFFSKMGVVITMIYPWTVLLFVYMAINLYKYVTEERQKRFIKSAFSAYLAPTVVDQLIKSPEKLTLGGEEREITAFFSDVQGFTSISQKLSAPELVELLNEFLTEMTDIILDMKGTMDKYEGDAIIAFWGAPLDIPDHAALACEACVYMQRRMVELRKKLAQEGRPVLKMRIGMNTGKAVVGNMGSQTKLDYTMMGDTVNTAARLEGVNKIYGTYTMVSDSTYHQAAGKVEARELDAVVVVGRDKPVRIYELLGIKGEVSPTLLQVADLYSQGLSLYRARRWDHAASRFAAALAIRGDDGPSRAMLERCLDYKKTPPPPDWDGSYSMTSK
jgi:adenylate cyclase